MKIDKLKRIQPTKTNSTLLNELKAKYLQEIKSIESLLTTPTPTLNQLSQLHSTLSKIITQWTNLELTHQKLSSLSLQQFQNPQTSPQNNYLHSQLISYDISVKCQISGSIPLNPARTNQCRFICVVERKVLKDCGVCSCGREVEEYDNQIVEDWLLRLVVMYHCVVMRRTEIKSLQSENCCESMKQVLQGIDKDKKWNGSIRVHLDKGKFEFIKDFL